LIIAGNFNLTGGIISGDRSVLRITFAADGLGHLQEKEKMGIWKGGKTTQQVADELLRNYLVRCHRIISKDYPEIANLNPPEAANYLLYLRSIGRIAIKLYNKSSGEIGREITEVKDNEFDRLP
jgi:hypothetical protein